MFMENLLSLDSKREIVVVSTFITKALSHSKSLLLHHILLPVLDVDALGGNGVKLASL